MKILITGVQNAIEESVVKIAIERLQGRARFRVLSFSDFVDTEESATRELNLLKNTRKKITDAIKMRMLKSGASDNVIINGYFTVRGRLGFFPVISREVVETFSPDMIVSISVDPVALEGKLDNKDEFIKWQDVERSYAITLGAIAGSGMKLIHCRLDESRKAADELYGLLKNLVVDK